MFVDLFQTFLKVESQILLPETPLDTAREGALDEHPQCQGVPDGEGQEAQGVFAAVAAHVKHAGKEASFADAFVALGVLWPPA